MLGCTTLINNPSFSISLISEFDKLKLQSTNGKKNTVKKSAFIFFSIKKFAINTNQRIVKKVNPKIPKNLVIWMNSLSKAQICPVKFNGSPPNSLDLSISANKKNKLTINDFKKILSFRN